MDLFEIIILYVVISSSLALTSYFMLFRPAIRLLEEILDTDDTIFSGILGAIIWIVIGTIMSPYIFLYLVKNDNKQIIEELALNLVGFLSDDE